jgi:ATP-binding cassette, subfamily B, bacterial
MTRSGQPRASPRRRLRAIGDLAGYAFHIMIAPWPFFGVVLIVLGIVGGLAPIAQIAVIARLIDTLTTLPRANAGLRSGELAALLRPIFPWLGLLIGLRVISALISTQTFQRYLASLMNERVQERIHQSLLRKALASRLEVFESAAYYDTLQLARRALQSGRIITELTDMQLLIALTFSCVGVLVALARVHWSLPAIVLLGYLIVSALFLRLSWNIVHLNEILNTLHRRATYWRDLVTRRESATEVRLFQLGDHLVAGWLDQMDQLNRQIAAARSRVIARIFPAVTVENAIYCVVALLILRGAQQNALSAGVFVALFYALLQLRGNFVALRLLFSRSQQFYADLRHSHTFRGLPGEERREGSAVALPLRDGIRFENVSFCYPGSTQPALVDVALHIRPGERIALVGENGAGKSTLAKLLLGLYQPTSGRIIVDGTDLSTVAPAAWRAHVGGVLQDFMRYALTARENIGVGCLDRIDDRAAIEQAAQLSSAAGLIAALPQGYDTLLSKEFAGGQDLSLGQWQKLALARAYLRDAPILVLDEPTAALDAITEREVYRQFLALAQAKTVLLISHRVGSARLADRIIVLQHGRLVQQGPHDELVAYDGPYAELYRLQAARYQDEEVRSATQTA